MPKWRKLHVKALESEDIHEMPDDFTRFLWILLPLVLDREGRGRYSAAWVRSKVFPLRTDVTIEQVETAFGWYAMHDMVVTYHVDERPYFHVPSFPRYQGDTAKEAESYYPAPPDFHDDESRPTPDLLQSKSGPTPELVATKSGSDADADADADADSTPPPPHGAYFTTLRDICQLDSKIKSNAGRMNRAAKELRVANVTLDEIRRFYEGDRSWWWSQDWRGVKGEPPKPEDIGKTVGIARTWASRNGKARDGPLRTIRCVDQQGNITEETVG